jgi:phosphohistidine phosphatase
MKTLLLMRHAKSSWKNKDLPDSERPLNHRGEKDAPNMGQLLKKKKMVPDLILTSPSVRTQLTAKAVADKCGYNKEIVENKRLYMAETAEIFEVLRSLPDETNSVLLIGHNPGLEGILQILTGQVESLSTATIAYINFKIDRWCDLNAETHGELIKLWRPKD